MGLTVQVEQKIVAVDLNRLFARHKDHWINIGKETFTYLRKTYPAGAAIRPDDVSKSMLPILQATDLLQKHLAQKRLTQKYWYTWFADYICDRDWDEIQKGI